MKPREGCDRWRMGASTYRPAKHTAPPPGGGEQQPSVDVAPREPLSSQAFNPVTALLDSGVFICVQGFPGGFSDYPECTPDHVKPDRSLTHV